LTTPAILAGENKFLEWVSEETGDEKEKYGWSSDRRSGIGFRILLKKGLGRRGRVGL